MTHIVVTGAGGQLGTALRAVVPEATFLSRTDHETMLNGQLSTSSVDWCCLRAKIDENRGRMYTMTPGGGQNGGQGGAGEVQNFQIRGIFWRSSQNVLTF